jgi:hypothetical protein
MEKVISFCGIEKSMAVYYTAAILSGYGKAVLVIDNSYSNDIYHAVSGYAAYLDNEEQRDFIVKQNITYMKNVNFHEDYDSGFDFVLIWHGMNIREEELLQSDEVYVMPDYMPGTLFSIRDRIKDKSCITMVFMLDSIASSKITEQTAAEFMKLPAEKIQGVIGYDESDYAAYISFLYNGRLTLSSMSAGYSEILRVIAQDLLQIDGKAVEKLFKKIKKAKSF